jgi:UDP-N-acetylglucosamine acyltransferase
MIHKTAVIDSESRLGVGVRVGPYSIIGPDVEIGDNTEIQNHVVVNGPTKIGAKCRIFSFASIGLEPQDKKYQGEKSSLEIGDNTLIREYVTINRGTDVAGGVTRVGSNGWIMAYCHIAHDCQVGDNVTMSNGTTLGGHVVVNNNATLGGLTGVHQFCRVGEYAIIGGQSMITQDVVPFSMVAGNHAKLVGINHIGLDRNGFSPEEVDIINQAYKVFFKSGLTRDVALSKLRESFPDDPNINIFARFIESSERGVCR